MNALSKYLSAVLLAASLAGCATTHNNPADPFEGFNRAVFNFNDGVDRVALKPAATAYREILPTFVQTGVGNFFGNLADVWTSVNNLLQGNIESGLNDMMRVVVNTTLGFGGLLDIGSEAGLQKHKEDFGQTLGVWGIKSGPYVVLPLLGPSTLRDAVAMPVDFAGDPVSYVNTSAGRTAASVVRVVDLRASSLEASNLVEDAAIDRYEFIRDAYLQRRESKINRGEPTPRKDDKASVTGNEGNPVSAAVESELPAATVKQAQSMPLTRLIESPVEGSPVTPMETAGEKSITSVPDNAASELAESAPVHIAMSSDVAVK